MRRELGVLSLLAGEVYIMSLHIIGRQGTASRRRSASAPSGNRRCFVQLKGSTLAGPRVSIRIAQDKIMDILSVMSDIEAEKRMGRT